jgi:5'(3')-deoxyribonucleotidase
MEFEYKRDEWTDLMGEDVFSGYQCREKQENGDIFEIGFMENVSSKKVTYGVYFEITRNKNKENYLVSTGRNGLKGLLWAKKALIEFEEFIQHSNIAYGHRNKQKQILIMWDDNRRQKAYKRGMKGMGYREAFWNKKKCLLKKIN